jgi:DNA-binding transcriptional LysR family regulator
MLDLNRLFLLHQLDVLGTISKVAQTRSQTRPAVSQQLARLEEEVGVALFERSGRGVELTSMGKSLVARSRELFQLAERIESDLVVSKHRISGEVRVSAIGSVGCGLIPKALTILAKRHPEVDIVFNELESPDGQRAAAARQVDLAVVDDSVEQAGLAGSLQLLPIGLDSFMAVLSANHPLARRAHIALADLAHERWCINRASVGYYGLLMNACHASGFEPRIKSSCRNAIATLELIRVGSVVAVLPSLSLTSACRDADFAILPLLPALTRKIVVATVRESSRRPLVGAVIAALREAMAIHAQDARLRRPRKR